METMLARVRVFDWSRTSLGPIENWPQSLRVAVDICLNNRFPMHVWWGPELIYIYNDAHVPVLGKRHPAALGQSAQTVWSDIWSVLLPQVEAVMHRGESTWNERTHVILERKGMPEDAWFTWSYSPLRNEAGQIAGLMCVATEETEQVLAEAQRDRLEQERELRRASEHAQAEQALRDSMTLLRGISDSTGDVIFAKDRQGRMRFVNPAALSLIAKPMEQVIGKTDEEVLEDTAAARAAMANDRQVMESGLAADFEEIVSLADGTRRIWFSKKMPYRDGEGNVIGILGISRDITERKIAEDEVRQARDAAETANKAKDRLLSVVSHELRTPLNPILAMASLLETREDLPAGLREDIQMIRRNVEQEARIVDDLLNVTRLQRGKILLHHEVVDLHRLLDRVIRQFSPQSEHKRLTVQTFFGATPQCVWADPGRMEQVFSNLLGNAVKFTPEGGSISVRVVSSGENRLRIEISDTGVGIEPEVLPKLFNPFEQGEQTVTRRFGGLGLGLVIVKGIMDLHGGTITATSAGRDKGTILSLELDAIQSPRTSQPDDASPAIAPANPRHRILLVEDHEDTLRTMRRILTGLGYIVLTATSVSEAMEKIENEAFDLLVSDIGLPDGSGLDIMRSLRLRKKTKGIALSGFGDDDDILRSRAAGFADHLVKPVGMSALGRALERELQA
jgi:PAS domain S-box-containing protein